MIWISEHLWEGQNKTLKRHFQTLAKWIKLELLWWTVAQRWYIYLALLLKPFGLFAIDVPFHAGLSSADEQDVPQGESPQSHCHRAAGGHITTSHVCMILIIWLTGCRLGISPPLGTYFSQHSLPLPLPVCYFFARTSPPHPGFSAAHDDCDKFKEIHTSPRDFSPVNW